MSEMKFNVDMPCEGCSNAVKRVLAKLPGSTVNIDMSTQTVSVQLAQGSMTSQNEVLEIIKKTGKAVKAL